MPPFAARAVPFLALLVAAAAFVPGSAGADCVEAGANLTCTNDDTDGIVAVGNTLTVDVQAGATVDNNALPNVNALELLNDNTVTTDATSSITTTVSTPCGQPPSRKRRPVVTRNGSPISLSGSACTAHSAWIEVMPGTTSMSGSGLSRRAIRSEES